MYLVRYFTLSGTPRLRQMVKRVKNTRSKLEQQQSLYSESREREGGPSDPVALPRAAAAQLVERFWHCRVECRREFPWTSPQLFCKDTIQNTECIE